MIAGGERRPGIEASHWEFGLSLADRAHSCCDAIAFAIRRIPEGHGPPASSAGSAGHLRDIAVGKGIVHIWEGIAQRYLLICLGRTQLLMMANKPETAVQGCSFSHMI